MQKVGNLSVPLKATLRHSIFWDSFQSYASFDDWSGDTVALAQSNHPLDFV